MKYLKYKRLFNQITGITLIALIVTIIVLLILAGVSISMLTGSNGLISKSQKAKEENLKSQALEELKLKVLQVQIDKSGAAKLQDVVDYLNSDIENSYMLSTELATITGAIPDLTNKSELYVKYKNYWFKIDEKLVVTLVDYNKSESEKENYAQEIGNKTEFNYTGNYQEYEIKDTGYYYIQCWGASGGSDIAWNNAYFNNYGTGGYSSGFIKLNKGEKIYVYVGQQGANGITTRNTLNSSSFNGGGSGMGSSDGDDGGGAGGGATDIRLVSGNWDNFESLKSRIMVAGGGSGGTVVDPSFTQKSGGSGGGISATGSIWKYSNIEVPNHTYNATQTTGYKFGIGQNAITLGNAGGAGAGGGYYGGYSSIDNPAGGAGGGSGFISGYDGCDAISENSTEDNIIHTGQSIHYSGKCFTNAILLDGNSNKIPNKSTGNGYATITFLNSNYDNSLILYNLLK